VNVQLLIYSIQPPPPSIHGLDLSARLSPNLSIFVGFPENVDQAIHQIHLLHPNVDCRLLDRLNRGFHSPKLMGPILVEFSQIAGKILEWSDEFNGAKVLSNLDGKLLEINNGDGTEYLCRQMSQTVRLDLCLKRWSKINLFLFKLSQINIRLR
jgi:hypothetical protein